MSHTIIQGRAHYGTWREKKNGREIWKYKGMEMKFSITVCVSQQVINEGKLLVFQGSSGMESCIRHMLDFSDRNYTKLDLSTGREVKSGAEVEAIKYACMKLPRKY